MKGDCYNEQYIIKTKAWFTARAENNGSYCIGSHETLYETGETEEKAENSPALYSEHKSAYYYGYVYRCDCRKREPYIASICKTEQKYKRDKQSVYRKLFSVIPFHPCPPGFILSNYIDLR